jgi:serine/threonine-protein kinase
MTEAATAPVKEGDVLAGKYRIERVLGVGGMGVVVAAMHMQLDQRVALKFLHPEALENKDVVARFAREARAAAKIQSEHVARVVDVGTLETGSPYMVMEYLEGSDLGAIVEERGALPAEDAVGYVLQACEAIAEAHAAHIVHRDLKPANLFLAKRADKRAIIKVLDFGISKSSGKGEDVSLTRTTAVMGSPLYMSPEQMASAKMVDQRSDIWALGVILYELVTGVPPFVAESMTEVIASILMHQPAPPSSVSVSPGLTAVINKCLEKEPPKRYQNVAELVVALAPFGPASQRGTVERVTRVLGGSVKPAPMAPSPQIDPAPAAPAEPPRTSISAPSMKGASPEQINKLAVAKTHASWGRTDETSQAAGSRGKLVGGVAAAMTAVGVVVGVLAMRKPEATPPPLAVPQAVSTPAAAAPTASIAAVPPPPVVSAVAPAASSAAPSEAPSASAPSKPAKGGPGPGTSRGTPGRASAPSAAPGGGAPPAPPKPAPTATATARNPLQIDLK